MKKKMMIIVLFLGLFIASSVTLVEAHEGENHKDWQNYCIKAFNVIFTTDEWEKIKNIEKLKSEIIKKSKPEIFLRENKVITKTQYTKGFESIDLRDLKNHKASKTTNKYLVTLFMDDKNKESNYVSIIVEIKGTEDEKGTDKKTTNYKDTDSWNEKLKGPIFRTISGAVGFAFAYSIFGDIRFLIWHRNKKQENVLKLRKNRGG